MWFPSHIKASAMPSFFMFVNSPITNKILMAQEEKVMNDKDFLDLDALEEQFNQEFQDEETEVEETNVDQIEEDQEEITDESDEEIESDENDIEQDETEEEEEEEEESQEQEQEQDDVSFQNDKQNSAFAEMRRQNDALQKQLAEMNRYNEVIKEIADSNGLSTDELLQRYEQQKLEADAESQNVPVEYLQKQREMESELNRLKSERSEERFNTQVQSVVEKYGLSDQEVQDTMRYAFQNGFDLLNSNVNFEALYKAANFDSIVDKQVKEQRQKQLENKQKRMKSTSIKHGGSATQGASIDDEVAAFLKEQGF